MRLLSLLALRARAEDWQHIYPDAAYEASPFSFNSARSTDPRRALATYCRDHKVGALDLSLIHI